MDLGMYILNIQQINQNIPNFFDYGKYSQNHRFLHVYLTIWWLALVQQSLAELECRLGR